MNPSFFDLPIETLITLVSGYIGYYIAHTGIRDHHKQIDVAFLTLIYGLIGFIGFYTTKKIIECIIDTPIGIFFGICAAITVSVYSSAWWRKKGRDWFKKKLYDEGISYADDIPSAWVALSDMKGPEYTQLTVFLNTDEKLICDDLGRFVNYTPKSLHCGTNGDILMYVTHTIKNGQEKEVENLINDESEIELTYIPANQIRRVLFRRSKK